MNRFFPTLFTAVAIGLACGVSSQAAPKGKPGGGGGTAPGNPAIVYTDSGPTLRAMDADGANQRVVFQPNGFEISYPRWHPNGQQIFFTYRPKSSVGYGIYRINLDSSGLTEILPPVSKSEEYSVGSAGDFLGDISPFPINGQYRIAFRRTRTNPKYIPHSYIFVCNENGGDVTQLTFGHEGDRYGGEESYPTWSPDGQSIAYTAKSGLRLLSLGLDSNGKIALSQDTLLIPRDTMSVSLPAFSRTENKIYFSVVQLEHGAREDLWALDLETLPWSPFRLTSTSLARELFVSHSGGNQITYTVFSSDPVSHQVTYAIETANPDGTAAAILAISDTLMMPSFKR